MGRHRSWASRSTDLWGDGADLGCSPRLWNHCHHQSVIQYPASASRGGAGHQEGVQSPQGRDVEAEAGQRLRLKLHSTPAEGEVAHSAGSCSPGIPPQERMPIFQTYFWPLSVASARNPRKLSHKWIEEERSACFMYWHFKCLHRI